MDKLLIPKGCVIQGEAVAISHDGDIVIENAFVPNVLHSASGGIRFVPQQEEVECGKIIAEQGFVDVEASKLSCANVKAQSAHIRAESIEIGAFDASGDLVIESGSTKIEECVGEAITITGDEVQGQSIEASKEVVIKASNCKFNRIKAPRVSVHGSLECKQIVAAESVTAEGGRIAVKSLDTPSFIATPDVTGIVMVATCKEVRAEGVRGFLHPSELGMLADGDDVVSIPTADLTHMSMHASEPVAEPEAEFSAPADEGIVSNGEFEVPTVSMDDEAEEVSLDVAAEEPVEEASDEFLEMPTFSEETDQNDEFDSVGELSTEDIEELPESGDDASLDEVPVSDPTMMYSPEIATQFDDISTGEMTAVDDDDFDDDTALEMENISENIDDDEDAPASEGLPDMGENAFDDLESPIEVDSPLDEPLDDLEPLDPDLDDDDDQPLDVSDIEDVEEVLDADDLEDEDLEAIDVTDELDEIDLNDALDPEEEMARELNELLGQIRSFFPEDNIPNSINQIQRYIDERRFNLFAKARNREAVLSNFDKFEHQEISRLVRDFFAKIELYLEQNEVD